MAKGTVKWFNDAKGFGFICSEDVDTDIFVHHTSIQAEGFRTLAEGEQVDFGLTEGPKGPKAENVMRPAQAQEQEQTQPQEQEQPQPQAQA